MRIAEVTPVKYELFAGVVFFPTSAYTLPRLIRGAYNLRGWRPKFAMVWLLFSSIVVLAMPSVIDASTGYLQPQSLFYMFTDSNNNTDSRLYGPNERLPLLLLRGQITPASPVVHISGVSVAAGFSSSWHSFQYGSLALTACGWTLSTTPN